MNLKNKKEGIHVSSFQNVPYAIYAWQYKIYIIKNIILFLFVCFKGKVSCTFQADLELTV